VADPVYLVDDPVTSVRLAFGHLVRPRALEELPLGRHQRSSPRGRRS
jgi:hypothetical protein